MKKQNNTNNKLLSTRHLLQDRYRIKNILGKGGYGAIYIAEDIKLNRTCVVKQMLLPADISHSEVKTHQNNFKREAKLLVQLNHPGHPNIPEIYDHFSELTGNYLVMKYIEGQNLKDILEKNKGKIPWREAVQYMVDACGALHYMHTHGKEPVLHRDIKPANILLGNDKRIWLVDFGLARANPVQGLNHDTKLTQATGTVGYSALEQWFGTPVPASDVYAVGATLHHLITGLDPTTGLEYEDGLPRLDKLHGNLKPICSVDPNLPRALESIIAEATAAKAEKRPTILQLQQKLQSLISGPQTVALYTFKNGQSAKTNAELVDLCRNNRQEAQEYLYNGDFENWFKIINRNDLAQAAAQAVEKHENQKRGLKKFLRLISPAHIFRRAGKASSRATRFIIQVALVLIVALILLIIAGSYAAGWAIEKSLSSYDWDFSQLAYNKETHLSEAEVNAGAEAVMGDFLEDISLDIQPPDQINLKAKWGGISLNTPLSIKLESGKPHFYLNKLNGIPLLFIGSNISNGINNGINQAFEDAPITINTLNVYEEEVTFMVTEKD